MNIIKQFTLKNLKLNKKRTIVTIIGVMLSTALICAVAGMVTSFRQTMVNAYKKDNGNYYARFQDVPKDQLKYIENNENVKSYFITEGVGYANLDGSKNADKPYVYVTNFSKDALQNDALKLENGRMPENSNEVVISSAIITNAGVKLKIGDNITLDIGTRELKDGTVKAQDDAYNSGNEQIVDKSSKTYKIVGIAERPDFEPYNAPGYTIVSYLNSEDDIKSNADVSALYKNAKDYKKTSENIADIVKSNTGKEINIKYNKPLAELEGGGSENNMQTLYRIAAVIIVIILVSSIFVIRNSFNISVSEKTKQYGMMSSIGATSKQIRKSVLYEGFIIGIIGIILGIILGTIAIAILICIINYLLKDALQGINFVYSVPMAAIGISIAVSIITIYLSCIIPAHKACKISPIEAIRENGDIKIKAKKLRTSKLTQKVFGVGGVIASKNLKRNKKKYRTTVISLVVSITIFISLSTLLTYGSKVSNMYYTDLGFNLEVGGDEDEKDVYKEISKLDGVDDYAYSYITSIPIDIQKYGSDYGKNSVQGYGDGQSYIEIVMFNNEYFKRYVKSIGLDEENYKNIAILQDDARDIDKNGKITMKHNYNINPGEKINLNIDGKDTDVTVTGRADKSPWGYKNDYSNGSGFLFTSEDFIKDKTNVFSAGMCIVTKNANQLENTINTLIRTNTKYSGLHVTNLDKYEKQEKNYLLLIAIFLYGFIAVITLIGVTNIFNTITTNMILRSKEFAMLKSIGMTSKEFNKMIRLESILYGLKSLIIGIPLGILGSYLIYTSISHSLEMGYIVPFGAIIVSIVFVFIIVGLTMRYSLNKINKQNIIETIREENI